jgi:hypothetical protein
MLIWPSARYRRKGVLFASPSLFAQIDSPPDTGLLLLAGCTKHNTQHTKHTQSAFIERAVFLLYLWRFLVVAAVGAD